MKYDTDRPIYLQVIDDISHKMVRGEIQLGEKLPSVRELAVLYQINPNTASRVYKEMESKGLCFTRRGTGTFITEETESLDAIRKEMAGAYLDAFLQGMQALGIGFDDMIRILKERYDHE